MSEEVIIENFYHYYENIRSEYANETKDLHNS